MNWINIKIQNGNSDNDKIYSFGRWMSWLFFLASILLLIYTYYRAEITPFDGDISIYYKYYIISFLGILFWGLVLRLHKEIRTNIVMIAISLLVGIYMIEGGLIFLGLEQVNRTSVKLGVDFDQRTKLEVIESLIAEGEDAVPAVRPRDLLTMDEKILPLGGISNKTTVGENESGQRMVYLSDRYGFNNPDSEWDAKKVEWLLTGDSFTEGVAVQPGEDIAGQLRFITQKSAINLGRSGNGPLMELAEITEYIGAIKPKKVLWIYSRNDLTSDLQRDKKIPLLMRYMDDKFSQNLINRQKEIDSKLEKYIIKKQVLRKKNSWVRLAAIRNMLNFDVGNDIEVTDDPMFAEILTKAKERVEGSGGDIYFIYLPKYYRYTNTNNSYPKLKKKSEVINIVKAIGIPVIDIHQEVFANHPNPKSLFPFSLGGHYNAEGYN